MCVVCLCVVSYIVLIGIFCLADFVQLLPNCIIRHRIYGYKSLLNVNDLFSGILGNFLFCVFRKILLGSSQGTRG